MRQSPAAIRALARHPVVRGAGRVAFLAGGAASCRWRPEPEFLILGGKRTGSTSLYYGLLANPHVLPQFPAAATLGAGKGADTKGVHWFDRNARMPPAWYRGHFPSVRTRAAAARRLGGPVVTGEASPYYLFHPLAPQLAARRLPDARLVVVLRDPVTRTWSHWKEQTRNGVETLSFEAALDAEPARTRGEAARLAERPGPRSWAHENQSYATQSAYLPMLRRWLEHFSRDRLLLLLAEEVWRDPQAAYDRVADFVGVPRHPAAPPPALNAAPGAAMDEGVRRRLVARFAPDDEALAGILGRPTGWDRG